MRKQLEKQEQDGRTPVQIHYYHCDHLGTPIALTDSKQNVVWAARLDPWGNLEEEYNPGNMDQPIRLPGQHHDRETGLYYNRHRYYDPMIGSYINQDPIGLAGGINSYHYPTDPIGWIDPLGLLKTFSSADKAALDVLKTTNPKSIKDNREYAGMICQKDEASKKCESKSLTCNKTVFFATKPKKGSLAGANPGDSPCPPGSTPAGDYHTHGDYSLTDGTRATAATDEYKSLKFSDTDISGITKDGIGKPNYTGYLGSPNGVIQKYTPASGKIEVLK